MTERALQRQMALDELSRLHEAQRRLHTQLQEATRRYQALCDHVWVYYPIAGEGRYCKYCNYDDPNFED